ncbi:MAG: iron-containing alcohol dehydrogenase [Candidatus Aenigmarchaeota archaeon]|nr:iron-containing alcohol dehydrogenase [Candidatus Aenigmarchaeota archaeon]
MTSNILLDRIEEILKTYNKDNFVYSKVIIKNNIEMIFSKTEIEFKNQLPKDQKNLLIITDPGFSGTYLDSLNIYHEAKIWKINEETLEEVNKIISNTNNISTVMGFGGGRSIDVAKMTAFKLKLPLITVPSTPSHDGLIAKNCALIKNGIKKSSPTMYPKKIIIPRHLWITSGDLKRAGALDIASNIVALQDVSLSINNSNFKPDYEHLTYALLSVRKILWEQTTTSLAEALILSGLAMDTHSNYCSGSDHEIEKAIIKYKLSKNYFHGQLAGTGAVIASKIYELYADKLPNNLFFDSTTLHKEIIQLLKKYEFLEFALKPIKENKEQFVELLKTVTNIRPERYTLWNVIDSKNIDWDTVLDSILENS